MAEIYYSFEVIKDTIMGYIGEQTVSRYCSSDECKAARLGAEGVIYALEDAPTADVGEVVKCKHCEHLMTDVSTEYTPYGFENDVRAYGCKRIFDLTGEWVDVMLDDFCSYGERKDGEE